MKKFLKGLGLFIVVLAIVVGTPIVINKYVPPNNNGALFSFLGSYLGGIFGGLATLIGVLYTIKSSDKSRKEEEDKKDPFIVPLEKTLLVCKNPEDEHFKIEHLENDVNYGSGTIYIDFMNLGEEHGLYVSMAWNQPSKKDKIDFFNKYKENQYLETVFNSVCVSTNPDKRENIFQVIKSCRFEERKKTYLFVSWRTLITTLTKHISIKNKELKIDKSYENIPLGQLEINCKNVQGKLVQKKYLILGYISNRTMEENGEESYLLNLSFKLIDEK
ncbi:hypothetical protein [Clostridioides difficile]|uniref:hypothetical protein n=1 Tax=Clostridioides difficile TaxID=1496 RepID=UPI00093C7790|nr:hypothetical protein [Clostridioides difficile]MBY1133190.1 hypothetical protein [Clostridioides difficile]MBY1885486.1 hypothetical protein [Clostridioides difficile]MBZ0856030.1 hypothetical protein [Clostridioides difficile]MCG7701922.1 hypothetical protein [Clostridioides difficile]MDU8766960.1 hypothetical protein [Clostridioides difficile]